MLRLRVAEINKSQSLHFQYFDFLVITKDTIEIRKKRMLKSRLRKELARLKIPADILIQSEDEIDSKKEITGHILKQVLKEGVAL